VIVVKTQPNATLRIVQQDHEFWFGSAIANQIFNGTTNNADCKKYKQAFLENFNCAVTENALKWLDMEKEKGHVDFSVVDNILDWTYENDIPLRGHNIYWGVPMFVQDWVKELDDEQLYDELHKRARTIALRYKGKFAEYDLNNEMIHGNYYVKKLGKSITLDMANWIKKYDPTAQLYLNDYNVLTGVALDDFIIHIRELLDMGVPIDGIGVQGHLHDHDFDRETLQYALNELSQFNLPIRITEFNMPGQTSKFYKDKDRKMSSEEELLKAKNLEDYYRICFANPAVTGILMWGFWEDLNWIPASSLYKKDWSPTPALESYRSLVFDEWWTNFEGKADEKGMIKIPAFYGTHKIEVNDTEKIVNLKQDQGITFISIQGESGS
jgi:GH35 family endo-1,4-beta-xylanase